MQQHPKIPNSHSDYEPSKQANSSLSSAPCAQKSTSPPEQLVSGMRSLDSVLSQANELAQAPPAENNPSPESAEGGCLPRPCLVQIF